MLDESGYTAMWQKDKSIEAPGRLENLKELIHALEEFDSLGGFLEHVSLVMENAAATDGEMITIMTLHGAKGLEFDIVFLPGWEEGLFPSQRSLDENGIKGLEEERRLAYVGLTRARKRAHDLLRRQPAHPQHVAERAALALHRGTAEGAYRARRGSDLSARPERYMGQHVRLGPRSRCATGFARGAAAR